MTARKTPASAPLSTPLTNPLDDDGFGSNLGGEAAPDGDDGQEELPPLNTVIKAPKTVVKKAAVSTDKRIRIRLEDNDQIPPGGQFFSVNGRGYLIQANEEVNVPIAILSILDTAIEEHAIADGNGTVINYRKRLRFPYTVLGILGREEA